MNRPTSVERARNTALLEELKELASLEVNSVVRRVLQTVRQRLGVRDASLTYEACDREKKWEGRNHLFDLMDAISEHEADDRRRSVVLDPEENTILNLVDYFSGRLSSLEIRMHGGLSKEEADFLELKAIDRMKGKYPVITIRDRLADSDAEIVDALRELADVYEARSKRRRDNTLKLYALKKMGCRHGRTEYKGIEFRKNGKEAVKVFHDIGTCRWFDRSCCNEKWKDDSGTYKRVVVWKDGDSFQKPPRVPPPFSPSKWKNKPALLGKHKGVSYLSSDFGWRRLPIRDKSGKVTGWKSDFHSGIDIAAPVGTPVLSATAGTVVYALKRKNWHHSVVWVRTGGQIHVYRHIDVKVKKGQTVRAGQQLGKIQKPPKTREGQEHLHYSIHVMPTRKGFAWPGDGNAIDPL